MKNVVIISLFAILFIGCARSGKTYTDPFIPWYQPDRFPQEAFLKDNETPTIINTTDLDAKFREITSHWYWCIGQASFSGRRSSYERVQDRFHNICLMHKTKVAVWKETLVGTKRATFSVPQTNYHTSITPYGATRSYSTTTFSTQSYEVDTYDYSAYFFIPIPQEYRDQYTPGFSAVDLTPQDCAKFRQNTGSLITVVYDKTVAFYANLFPGDIITQINGRPIYTSRDLLEVRNASKKGDMWDMFFVRNGQLYRVQLKYDLYYSNNS